MEDGAMTGGMLQATLLKSLRDGGLSARPNRKQTVCSPANDSTILRERGQFATRKSSFSGRIQRFFALVIL